MNKRIINKNRKRIQNEDTWSSRFETYTDNLKYKRNIKVIDAWKKHTTRPMFQDYCYINLKFNNYDINESMRKKKITINSISRTIIDLMREDICNLQHEICFEIFNVDDLIEHVVFNITKKLVIDEYYEKNEYESFRIIAEDSFEELKNKNNEEVFKDEFISKYDNLKKMFNPADLFPDIRKFKRQGNAFVIYKPFKCLATYISEDFFENDVNSNWIKQKYNEKNILEVKKDLYSVVNGETESEAIVKYYIEEYWRFKYYIEDFLYYEENKSIQSEALSYFKKIKNNQIVSTIIFLEFICDLSVFVDKKKLIKEYFSIINEKNRNAVARRENANLFREKVIIYYHVIPKIIEENIVDYIKYKKYKLKEEDKAIIEGYNSKLALNYESAKLDNKIMKKIQDAVEIINRKRHKENSLIETYLLPSEQKKELFTEEPKRKEMSGQKSEVIEDAYDLEDKLFKYKYGQSFDDEMNNELFEEYNELGIKADSVISRAKKILDYYEERYSKNMLYHIDIERYTKEKR